MRYISPTQYSATTHTNNIAIETDYSTAWNSTTAYTNNQKVYHNCKKWHANGSIAAGVTPNFDFNNPWIFDGICSKGGMFDLSPSTQSELSATQIATDSGATTSTPLIAAISSDSVNDSVALLGVEGDRFKIETFVAGGGIGGIDLPVWSSGEVSCFDPTGINDFYTFYFSPPKRKRDYVVTGIPPVYGQTARVTVWKHNQGAKIGTFIFGFLNSLGESQWGAKLGIKSNLEITDADLNNVKYFDIKSVSNRRTLEATAEVPSYTTSRVMQTLSDHLGKIQLFFIQNKEYTCTLGLFSEASVAIQYPTSDLLSLDIKGVL